MRVVGSSGLWVSAWFILLAAAAPAIEKNYGTGVVREVQQKSRDRILYYLYNTPIMQEEPYLEVSVQLGPSIVVGEYVPRYAGEPLSPWTAGDSVQVRVEKHYLYFKLPSGGEVKFRISDRYTPKSAARP